MTDTLDAPATGPKVLPVQLHDLINLGGITERWLQAVGIANSAELRAVGAVEAFWRIKRSQPGASSHLLIKLHGAIVGQRWSAVDAATQRLLYRLATPNA